MENALIYSDNIYFAKAALQIGSEELENSLERLGFHQELPFEIQMAQSQYSNTEHIETEIRLRGQRLRAGADFDESFAYGVYLFRFLQRRKYY